MNYLRPAVIGLLAALALLPAAAAPAHAQDATGQIAFTRGPFDSSDVYVMNADGSGQTNLTNSAAADFAPAWSPDGSRIAFESRREPFGIYVMNADGSDQTWLSPGSYPDWSPDGTKIAFSSDGINVMNADGSGQTRLTDVSAGNLAETWPAWSPDGSQIAFVSSRGTVQVEAVNLSIMNADGSALTDLTNTQTTDIRYAGPAWAPDGERIAVSFFFRAAFTGGAPGFDSAGIVVQSLDGSQVAPLVGQGIESETTFDWLPTWSPDGASIAFVSGRESASEIYTMNADGSGRVRLTDNSSIDTEPDWSPLQVAEPTPTASASAQETHIELAFPYDVGRSRPADIAITLAFDIPADFTVTSDNQAQGINNVAGPRVNIPGTPTVHISLTAVGALAEPDTPREAASQVADRFLRVAAQSGNETAIVEDSPLTVGGGGGTHRPDSLRFRS